MVGIAQIHLVKVFACELLVVEDIVDAHLFLASESVHPVVATFFERIDQITFHRFVNVGIRNIVEVTADNDWKI